MTLQESNSATYDNNSILMRSLLNNKQQAAYAKIESRDIVYQLLAHFLKQATIRVEMKDNRIEKAILYMRKHLYETIELTVLAEKSCLSKDHFIRLLKKETGVTPLKYINQKK